MFGPETKVLVVDDMKTMRLMIKKALATLGMTNVTEADDGATAWPLIEQALGEQKPFQLVISDWNMPQMKGIELLKKVRANQRTKSLPFVLVTAETEKEQVMEAIQAGVSNYVSKPFTADTIKEKLEVVHQKLAS